MKYIDEYRDGARARQLLSEIRSRAPRRWVLMEVCGGQTHSLLRHGIVEELCDVVQLIHGPGCPVCVTPAEAIDFAQAIAMQPKTTLVSFGDMVRVPGSQTSLLEIRSRGGNTKTVYSPLDAVELAQRNPDEHYVFFAVGFETTAPATALAVLQANRLQLQNFSMLVSHVRVQPAMEAILRAPDNRVQAFLAAGHVCTVTGFDSYDGMSQGLRTPIVVTGFEPLDLLEGILACVTQLESGHHIVENRYARCVSKTGNTAAQKVIDQVYQVADRSWRGLGEIANGGYILKSEWRQFDATQRFRQLHNEATLPIIDMDNECQAAEVLSGRLQPTDCTAFGKRCTPDSPLGAPMVSSEGACAAHFRYGQMQHALSE